MDNMLEDGNSYHELRSGYLSLTGNYGTALSIFSRFIGGVHIDRSRVGQQTDNKPFTPVAYAEQKRAMNILHDYAFAPDAFEFEAELLNYLKMQRRGWDFPGSGEDPKLHSRVLTMQKSVLSQVMHRNVLARLTNSGMYGNEYSVAEMMGDLTAAIFDADLNDSVNTFRQQLQLEYVHMLDKTLNTSSTDYIAQSAALYQLNDIKSKMARAKSPDASTRAHREHVVFAIDKIMDKE
jgi:hypothetical protein